MIIDSITIQDPNTGSYPEYLNRATFNLHRSVNGYGIPQQFSDTTSYILNLVWTHADDTTISTLETYANTGQLVAVEIDIQGTSYNDNYYVISDSFRPGTTLTKNIQVRLEPEV